MSCQHVYKTDTKRRCQHKPVNESSFCRRHKWINKVDQIEEKCNIADDQSDCISVLSVQETPDIKEAETPDIEYAASVDSGRGDDDVRAYVFSLIDEYLALHEKRCAALGNNQVSKPKSSSSFPDMGMMGIALAPILIKILSQHIDIKDIIKSVIPNHATDNKPATQVGSDKPRNRETPTASEARESPETSREDPPTAKIRI
jgi:hypothetical protein